jgi:hypothetical protein
MTNLEIIGLLKILCGLAAFIVAAIKGVKVIRISTPETIGLFGIWFFGLLAFLLGLLGQSIQMISVFDEISQIGDVNASIIADGISKSSSHTASGLLILIISVIFWGIVKGIQNSRMKKIN